MCWLFGFCGRRCPCGIDGRGARIRDFEVGAGMFGMKVNAAKSVTISLDPCGKERMIRMCSDYDFRVEGGAIAALDFGQSFS